ncbi:hypothetical protein HMPREF3198_00955 [Winkia neuii]|nr:hypothetical protein HMPREF3198_00955 [Winkia neuii]
MTNITGSRRAASLLLVWVNRAASWSSLVVHQMFSYGLSKMMFTRPTL